jgi:glycosyltransferase involved in cell wall biosynthesis
MRPTATPNGLRVFEVPEVDFHKSRTIGSKVAAARTVWNGPDAARTMNRALKEFRPDIVHFHNIAHQLSQIVVERVNSMSIPSVMTCHDFKLVCPSYLALRKGRPCFRCSTGSTVNCMVFRCLHGSLSWSALAAAEAKRTRAGAPKTLPQMLICPSDFMLATFEASWLGNIGVRLVSVPNPVERPPATTSGANRSGGIYVGRLTPEKGVDIAIKAAAMSGVSLTVVGDGPDRNDLECLAEKLAAPVSFVGFRQGEELENLWFSALFQVVPSIWPENAPLAVIEGLVRGIPFVGSDIGGLPELARAGGAAVLVPARDVGALAEAMNLAASAKVGLPNVALIQDRHGWQRHLGVIQDKYQHLCSTAPR